MFNSPAGGATGLFQSPVSGFTSPAAQIAEGELVMEQVSQLTSQLAQKQNIIANGDLTISKTNGLQTALNDKVELSTFNAANQQRISVDANLEQSILLKANTADVYTQAEVNGLLTAKQNIINDSDLTIAKTNGLQSALDSKATTSALTSGLSTKADQTALSN